MLAAQILDVRRVVPEIAAYGTSLSSMPSAAACLEFKGRLAPGNATLEWMLTPGVLRALR